MIQSSDLGASRATKADGPEQLRRRERVGFFGAVAVALMLYAALHLKGMPITPACGDGWAYWQGAISIAQGHGYRDFGSAQIIYWPPVYSSYLALWVVLLGSTALPILLANGVLVGAQAALWWHLYSLGRRATPLFLDLLAATYIAVFSALNHQTMYAQNITDAIIPALLISTWLAVNLREEGRSLFLWGTLAGILSAIGMNSHNSAVVFSVSTACGALSVKSAPLLRRIVLSVLVVVPPTLLWVLVRHFFEQDSSHPVGLGLGYFSASEYLTQLTHGIGALLTVNRGFMPIAASIAAALLLLVVAVHRFSDEFVRYKVVFGITALILLFIIFNITPLPKQELSGRFLVFLPLLFVPLIVSKLPLQSVVWAAMLWAALLAPVINWSGRWIGLRTSASLAAQSIPTGFVPYNARVDPTMPLEAALQLQNGQWVVGACDWWDR